MGGVPGTPIIPWREQKSRDERAERRLRVRAGCASSYVGRARRGVDDDGSIATRLLHHARTTPAGGSSSRASDSRISRASAHFRVHLRAAVLWMSFHLSRTALGCRCSLNSPLCFPARVISCHFSAPPNSPTRVP